MTLLFHEARKLHDLACFENLAEVGLRFRDPLGQDAADVLSTDLGLAVVSNAATQVLMRQSTQSVDAVSEAFSLTAGESRLLLSAPRGEGLLVA